MDIDVITSYLVALGYQVDLPQKQKFDLVLKQVDNAVEAHTSGLVSMFGKAATAIVASYSAIAGTILGLADHVAQSDLGRL